MAKSKFSDKQLIQLVKQGLSCSEIAKHFGVGRAAVSKRLKALKVGIAQNVALKSAGEIVPKEINATEQLWQLNEQTNWLLESELKRIRDKDSEEELTEYKFKDPREIALKAMCEIRGQLKLQLEIFQSLYDMRAVAAFQKEVLDAIGQASPEIREQIIRNLHARRAIRSTLEFNP